MEQVAAEAVARSRPLPPAAAPAQPAGDSRISQLQELAKLKEQGILSEEFAAEKARASEADTEGRPKTCSACCE